MPCGILDLDFEAGFDWLNMDWVYLVLRKKGIEQSTIDRLKRLYSDSYTIVVVNNMKGRCFLNIYGSLRQGDKPSMFIGVELRALYSVTRKVNGDILQTRL